MQLGIRMHTWINHRLNWLALMKHVDKICENLLTALEN